MLQQPLDADGLRGTVVNVGSVLDRSPSPEHFGTVAYTASKGAVRAMTLAAAARYAPDRIRFNLLVPGLIDTPMAARAGERRADSRPTWPPSSRSPADRERPIDVAEAALYLCEPASRFVTGTELIVDGGWCVSEGRFERLGRCNVIPALILHPSSDPGIQHERTTDVFSQYLAAVRAAIDAIEATQLPAIRAGGRSICECDSQGTVGPCLRDRPFADGRRGDVPTVWLVSRVSIRSSSFR